MGLFGSENKISLNLEKNEYIPGETIRGSVTLKLKKPTKAKKLEVSLVGIKVAMMRGRTTHGTSGHQHSHATITEDQEVIYSQPTVPCDEKEYFEESFNFEIPIPIDILSPEKKPEGRLAAAFEVLKESATISAHIEWSVDVNLDVPWKSNIDTYRKIIIRNRA